MRSHRSKALRAILTLTKAYLDAGAPDVGKSPFGSFETWDRMVRRPLVWAGMADPLEPAQGLRDEDHELVAMDELLHAWWELYGDKQKLASDVIKDATTRDDSPLYRRMADAVGTVLGSDTKMNAQGLARRFREWQGRIVGGFRLVRVRRDATRGVVWAVEKLSG